MDYDTLFAIVRLVWLAGAALFVLGLMRMNSPATARNGNIQSAIGMAVAVGATAILLLARPNSVSGLTAFNGVGWLIIVVGIAIGGGLGLYTARTVKMTAMPQLVSLFNAVGGGAAALIAIDDYLKLTGVPSPQINVATVLDIVIGSITFTGSLIASGKLSDIVISDAKVFFSLTVDAGAAPAWEAVRKAAENAVRSIPGVASVLIALTAERAGGAPPPGGSPVKGAGPAGGSPVKAPPPRAGAASRSIAGVPDVEAVIAVASGKGGVGKSTTAVNLALGLRDLGMRVGLLDADIYGPSMPRLLAIKGKPETIGGRMLRPMESFGLKVMSIGFLVDEETPMIWRGPMVSSAL